MLLFKTNMNCLLLPISMLGFCSIVYCGQVTDVTGDISKYRMLRSVAVAGQWGVGTPLMTSTNVSRIQCATQCSRNENCYIAEWYPIGNCNMYPGRNLEMVYPITTWISVSTVMMERPLNIVLVYGTWYSFDYTAASQACSDLGGRLITSTEMWDAYNAGELHIGSCGWIDGGFAYYILQHLVEGVGYPGVNICTWGSTWNAFCSISGYMGPS